MKQNIETVKIWIGQPSYTETIQFGLENCNPAATPFGYRNKATKDSELCDATLKKMHDSPKNYPTYPGFSKGFPSKAMNALLEQFELQLTVLSIFIRIFL